VSLVGGDPGIPMSHTILQLVIMIGILRCEDQDRVSSSTTRARNSGSSLQREESELRSGQYPVLCLCFPLSSEGSDIWNWGFRLKHDCCYKLIARL
jgi:hypothetical protein